MLGLRMRVVHSTLRKRGVSCAFGAIDRHVRAVKSAHSMCAGSMQSLINRLASLSSICQ